jgi:hypothetical protein
MRPHWSPAIVQALQQHGGPAGHGVKGEADAPRKDPLDPGAEAPDRDAGRTAQVPGPGVSTGH